MVWSGYLCVSPRPAGSYFDTFADETSPHPMTAETANTQALTLCQALRRHNPISPPAHGVGTVVIAVSQIGNREVK